MRGDLRRQIARLEAAISRLAAEYAHGACPRDSTEDLEGPALLAGRELELIRDQLIAVLRRLEARIAELG
jgi:hypothetical protein